MKLTFRLMENNLLNNLIAQLYNERWNFLMCDKVKEINQENLQELLDTQSKHKNLVKWSTLTNCWYLTVKLTSTGIHYYENDFKFDRELVNSVSSQVHIWTLNNSWNFALMNQGTQNITENDIADFLKLLEANQSVTKKDEIKKLLEEFKKTQNKSFLVDIFSILGNSASIGSFYCAIKALLM